MWLIILAMAAVIATALWYAFDDGRYKMATLCFILWGAAIMVFIDHLMSYLEEGGNFIETTANATLLGFVLLIVALIIWEVVLLLSDPKGKLRMSG